MNFYFFSISVFAVTMVSMWLVVQRITLFTFGELSTDSHLLDETKTNFTWVFLVRSATNRLLNEILTPNKTEQTFNSCHGPTRQEEICGYLEWLGSFCQHRPLPWSPLWMVCECDLILYWRTLGVWIIKAQCAQSPFVLVNHILLFFPKLTRL